jgi:23S rRNA pseudouridine2605 synthase
MEKAGSKMALPFDSWRMAPMKEPDLSFLDRLPPLKPQSRNVSLSRALSKFGYCSRAQAQVLIEQGRVQVNGAIRQNGKFRVDPDRDRIEVDGQRMTPKTKLYLMLNKPRGVVTTRSDEQARKTVYDCLGDRDFPWLSPVGRLDQASEGLLLLTNDTQWAAALANPESHVAKTYHVQIDRLADHDLREQLTKGIRTEGRDSLRAKQVEILRRGKRNSWLEIVLDEGKNRQIRRLLSAFGVNVLRLLRVAIGPIKLGNLPKGAYRPLTPEERESLFQAPKKRGKETAFQ